MRCETRPWEGGRRSQGSWQQARKHPGDKEKIRNSLQPELLLPPGGWERVPINPEPEEAKNAIRIMKES
ncbi:hypothetical protein TURU_160758 [Turdus rufiventris]|nr:hypothetical protein TURU_160758 [Turdus rufiventris]